MKISCSTQVSAWRKDVHIRFALYKLLCRHYVFTLPVTLLSWKWIRSVEKCPEHVLLTLTGTVSMLVLKNKTQNRLQWAHITTERVTQTVWCGPKPPQPWQSSAVMSPNKKCEHPFLLPCPFFFGSLGRIKRNRAFFFKTLVTRTKTKSEQSGEWAIKKISSV